MGRQVISLTELKTDPPNNIIKSENRDAYLKKPSPFPDTIGLPHCLLKPRESITLSVLTLGRIGRIEKKGKLFAGTIMEFENNKINMNNKIKMSFLAISLIFLVLLTLFILINKAVIILPGITSHDRDVAFTVYSDGSISVLPPDSSINRLGDIPLGSERHLISSSNLEGFIVIKHKVNKTLIDTVFKINAINSSLLVIGDPGITQLTFGNVFLYDFSNSSLPSSIMVYYSVFGFDD